jgi:hypothetical protein
VLRRRYIYEFDTSTETYTGRTWHYETDVDNNVIGDAFTVRHGRILLIERDDFDGPAAVTKPLYEVDLQHTDAEGFVEKELVVDLLDIANPGGIGTASSAGAYGVDDPFSWSISRAGPTPVTASPSACTPRPSTPATSTRSGSPLKNPSSTPSRPTATAMNRTP